MDLHCCDVTQLSSPTRPHEVQSRRPQMARKPHQGTQGTKPSNTTGPLSRKSSPSFVFLVDEAVLVLSMWEDLSHDPLTDTVNQVILLMRRRRGHAYFRR